MDKMGGSHAGGLGLGFRVAHGNAEATATSRGWSLHEGPAHQDAEIRCPGPGPGASMIMLCIELPLGGRRNVMLELRYLMGQPVMLNCGSTKQKCKSDEGSMSHLVLAAGFTVRLDTCSAG